MLKYIRKITAFAVAACSLYCVQAEVNGDELVNATGKLVIADTIGGEPVVKTMVLAWASVNPNVEITIEKVPLSSAVEQKNTNKYDMVIYSRSPDEDFALEPHGKKVCYAIEPAVIYANEKCTVDDISIPDLSRIFCGDVDSWESISGSPYSIRRYGVVFPAAGERVFCHLTLGQLGYCDAIVYSASAYDTAVNCSGSPYAIGFGGYLQKLPEQTKVLSVEGVKPTIENVVFGKYPLTHRRMAAIVSDNRLAELFAELLTSADAGEVIIQEEMVPPLVTPVEPAQEQK